jgi:HlyD family secretion protein
MSTNVHPPLILRDRRVIIALVVLLILAAAAVAARYAAIRLSTVPATISASGTLEAIESDVAPKVEGRLIDLRVQDGDAVKRGQIVAIMESMDPGLDLQQALANERAAQAQVGVAQAAYNLQQVTYQTTLAQAGEGVRIARADIASAQATYSRAAIDLHRERSLTTTGDVPQQALDDAIAAYRVAGAGVQGARQAHRQSLATLDNARAGGRLVEQRYAELLAAQAQLAQTHAALGLAKDHVHETKLLAPFDGYVISHNFEDGDLIEPGSAVMTIGDLEHPYVYAYVAESDLPRVKTGTHAQVQIDGIPGRSFEGIVTEIGDAAEFTPENVQTKEERIEYLVFRVKIQFTDTTGLLKPGLPVDVEIPAQ